jgi:TRAP-type uncharacterized transport system fused permease subunit
LQSSGLSDYVFILEAKSAIMTTKEKRQRLGHILAGIIILIHAYEHYEKGESITFHLIAGIVFLLVAFFHHPLSKRAKWVDGLFYFIEALVFFYTSYEYFHHGKKALPFAYLLAGIGYVVATVLISRKKMRMVEEH